MIHNRTHQALVLKDVPYRNDKQPLVIFPWRAPRPIRYKGEKKGREGRGRREDKGC